MLTYLEKFKTLPKAIQLKIEAPEVMTVVSRLSQEYKLNLASTILKVMVGEIKLENLGAYLINEFHLAGEVAQVLEKKLRREVFVNVIDFLMGSDQKSPLVFSEADESEVRTVKQPLHNQSFDDEVENTVTEILKQSRINFTDPLGSGKFRQVLKTYVRGSRDRLATREALIKDSELGGVALNRDTAERVLIIADNFLTRTNGIKKSPLRPLMKKIIPTNEEAYDLSASLKAQGKLKTPVSPSQPPIIQPKKIILDPEHELMPPVPAVTVRQPVPPPPPQSRSIIKEAITQAKIDKPILRRAVTPPPPPVQKFEKSDTGKVKMDDVRYEARALSPVEELRYFTLTNFRRLDPDPVQAVEKIKGKLELLAKDNYSKKIEAIIAWQESPLNRLYIAVCRRSLEDNLPLAGVLERELAKDKNFLQPKELSAIINLNKSLKF